jgi:hypothetical protein
LLWTVLPEHIAMLTTAKAQHPEKSLQRWSASADCEHKILVT